MIEFKYDVKRYLGEKVVYSPYVSYCYENFKVVNEFAADFKLSKNKNSFNDYDIQKYSAFHLCLPREGKGSCYYLPDMTSSKELSVNPFTCPVSDYLDEEYRIFLRIYKDKLITKQFSMSFDKILW